MPIPQRRTLPEIEQWLSARLASLLQMPVEKIDVTSPFDRLGLDSATAVGITLDLEDWIGREVDPEVLYDHPTIQELSLYLAGEFDQTGTPPTDNETAAGGS